MLHRACRAGHSEASPPPELAPTLKVKNRRLTCYFEMPGYRGVPPGVPRPGVLRCTPGYPGVPRLTPGVPRLTPGYPGVPRGTPWYPAGTPRYHPGVPRGARETTEYPGGTPGYPAVPRGTPGYRGVPPTVGRSPDSFLATLSRISTSDV
jgi:hypothetical protein